MWLEILILFLAIPVGYLLAWLTRDELVQGRNWFKIIALVSAISSVIFLFFNLTISLTLVFLSITAMISLIKSYDKRFMEISDRKKNI